MATQTVDSHQTSTSDEQTVKLISSEVVKVTEQLNLSSPQESAEDDREKGRADNLHIPDSTLSTSDVKAEDIQVEPPVVEVKKTDKTPIVDLPCHDNVKLEKESTFVAEAVASIADETEHKESPSTEPVGGEATELPVVAYLEKSIQQFDANDNVKSPPEEHPTARAIKREALEVSAAASAQKVEEQTSEAVGLPKVEVESSGETVDSQEKEKPALDVPSVIEVPEKVEIVSAPVEEVEEKKPKITDNLGLLVVADSGKGPAEAEEQPVTEFVRVEKETNKESEISVPEESVESPKAEAQPIEVVPVKEPVEVVVKQVIGTVEPPAEKGQPVDVHPIKGLEELIAKEISEPLEGPKEKEQASEAVPVQESREVVETRTGESVQVSKKNELLVDVHPVKETNESIEPLKNKEQPDEGLSQKESVEVIAREVSASIEPPKNKEQTDGGFSVTESGEVKEKETSDSTLGSEEIEKKEHEVIEIKDGIGELPEITKHVQDSYVEAETVKDEKPLAPGDDIGLPIGENIQEEEAQHTVESAKQDSVGQAAKSGPIEDSDKVPEKEQPATEFVSGEKEPKEEPETICVLEESVEAPKKEAQPVEAVPLKEPVEAVAKEVIETAEPLTEKEQPVATANERSEVAAKEVIEIAEHPTEKEQQVVTAKEISEVAAKEVIEKVEPPTEKQQSVVIAKETSESIKSLKNKEYPEEEVISQKELVEVAKEVSESLDPPITREQADEGSPAKESDEGLEKEQGAKEVISVGKEPREEPETAPVPDSSIEPPKKEELPIEVLPTEERVEVITKEIIETIETPTEKEHPIEVHPLIGSGEVKEKEIPEPTELPKEKEQTEVHPVQESRELVAEKISESVEIPRENEMLIEVYPVKELEVIVEGTSESIEPPRNNEQPDEALSQKESSEVIEKGVRASAEPPKNKEQADEGFPATESRNVKGKETSNSTLGSEEVEKQELAVIEVKDGVGELPEITKHVQDTYLEVGTVNNGKALAPEDGINPPIEGGKVQEEEAQYEVESDKQVSAGQVAKSGPIEDSSKDLEKEQQANEFARADQEPREEPETIYVPKLSVEPPKKEEQLVEVLPVEQVEVIEKRIIDAIELPTEKEQPIEIHPLKVSGEVVEEEITEPTELPKEKEQATEVQPVQESKDVMAEKISEPVEFPKENELLIEVQPVKELEVLAENTSESSVPPKNTEQADEGFPVTESGEVRAKETSASTLDLEEVEKQEPEVTEVKDGREEFPKVTNQVLNDCVEFETEGIVKGGKALALGDDTSPPLGIGQIHKEEEKCPVESDRQDSLGQGAQPSEELAEVHISPQDVKEDEKNESSHINVVATLSEVEAPAVEKVREDNGEKKVITDKADEDKYEKIQELTLPREAVVPRVFETDAVVTEKSTDNQKAGEVVDLIAETKIEESTKDEKQALVESGNAEHVNETAKEPQESEVEVKDKETVITGEVPKVNDKKEVPSKSSHKHSHNILSKVKQSLVKAKKAIIGKSPSSKTLSSEARDNIKVK